MSNSTDYVGDFFRSPARMEEASRRQREPETKAKYVIENGVSKLVLPTPCSSLDFESAAVKKKKKKRERKAQWGFTMYVPPASRKRKDVDDETSDMQQAISLSLGGETRHLEKKRKTKHDVVPPVPEMSSSSNANPVAPETQREAKGPAGDLPRLSSAGPESQKQNASTSNDDEVDAAPGASLPPPEPMQVDARKQETPDAAPAAAAAAAPGEEKVKEVKNHNANDQAMAEALYIASIREFYDSKSGDYLLASRPRPRAMYDGDQSDQDEDQGRIYTVERIVDQRIRGGEKQYLIKWAGYSEAVNSWEPRRNIFDKSLIRAFEERRAAQ